MSRPTAPYEPPAAQGGRRGWKGALVAEVEPGGPAERAGLEAGMYVTHVNGVELRDMIDWDWEADGPCVLLEGTAYPGTPDEFEFECEVERDWGEDWGVAFDGAVFDGMRICRNDCVFCFMKMLPKGMRRTLYLRDDDYRLSFLQGNFVTLTNVGPADVERIASHALSPLNVSLHAVTPEVRTRLMGKNAARGIEALEELLEAGIEVHAQVVLVPGMNDGAELERTLAYVEERELITTLGIVPLGFTRHQDTFAASFNEPERARAVIDAVRPYQLRARERLGCTRFQLADEFYLAAQVDPPAAEEYDGYPQYHDGIGMVRTFLDEAAELAASAPARAAFEACAARLAGAAERLVLVSGEGAAHVVASFVEKTPLAGRAEVATVRNAYFGGNVNVTGLLTASDVLEGLPEDLAGRAVLLPDIMLNADRLTLDGLTAAELEGRLSERGCRARFVQMTPPGILAAVNEM